MDLPSFSTLWDACETLSKLEDSINNIGNYKSSNHTFQKKRPLDTYYSDGICGVTFGIQNPEFSNPLETCCDTHFFTEEEFKRHESEHIKCAHDSCSLLLHPSIMGFHLETAHSDEVFRRLQPAFSDKTLVSWRESRKKHYPTFERMQAKIRETGYRIQRGQVLVTKRFGTLNRRKPQDLKVSIFSKVKKEPKRDVARPENSSSLTVHCLQPKDCTSEKAFNHALSVVASVSSGVSEQVGQFEVIHSNTMETQPTTMEQTSTATSGSPQPKFNLVDYESDISWSECHPEEDTPITEPKKESLLTQLSSMKPQFTEFDEKLVIASEGGHSSLDTAQTVSGGRSSSRQNAAPHVIGSRRPRRRRNGGRRQRGGSGRWSSSTSGGLRVPANADSDDGEPQPASAFSDHPVVRMASKRRECMRNALTMAKRPTLLHMLLAEDMRHERNQLMQCVRYVVQKNFFLD